jgi:hypothetical protein
VRLIVQNGGRLSNTKRPKFERYTDLEIGRTEEIVREAFAAWTERYRPVGTGAEAVESAPLQEAPGERVAAPVPTSARAPRTS